MTRASGWAPAHLVVASAAFVFACAGQPPSDASSGTVRARAPAEEGSDPGDSRASAAQGRVSELGPTVFSGPEICFNATDDNDNLLIDEGCEVRQGPIHIAVAWQERGADVDLHVVGPDGQVAAVGRKSSAGLILSGDCPGADRGCSGKLYESVHTDSVDAIPGIYRVRVRLESAERPELLLDEPLEVRLGVRTPTETRSRLVSFFEEGSEISLSVQVAEPAPQKAGGEKP